MTEKELIERAQAKDGEAFRVLIGMHKQAIFRFCYRLVREPEEADDIAQECFIRAYGQLEKFKIGGSFRAWLCSIANHEFLNRYRNKRRHSEAEKRLQEELHFIASVNQETEVDLFGKSFLNKALERLPVEYSQILLLRYVDGYSAIEISVMVDKPIATVKTRLQRGRALLISAASLVERSIK
jgi:RNA polymerase sigma-70 factor (ECF subfamily)